MLNVFRSGSIFAINFKRKLSVPRSAALITIKVVASIFFLSIPK